MPTKPLQFSRVSAIVSLEQRGYAMELGLTLGRFFAGAILSILLAIGGVWTVVGLAVSGMTSAVEATNARIGDLDGRITRLEARTDEILNELRDIRVEMAKGFTETKN